MVRSLKEWRNHFCRRLLTKPIWFWERNRPYPIIKKIVNVRPKQSDPKSTWRLVVLTTTETFLESLWAAYSATTWIQPQPEIVFYLDGEMPSGGDALQSKIFPKSRGESSLSVIEKIPANCPDFKNACKRNSSARKLAIQALENREKAVLYMDADILFFEKPVEILESIFTGNGVWHINAHEGLRADPKLMEEVLQKKIPHLEDYNSGLLYLSPNVLTCEEIEKWISPKRCDPFAWFIDQTILAILLPQYGSQLLPMDRYVASCRRQFYFEEDHSAEGMVMRHYMGPVRHLMYSKGMPRFFDSLKDVK